MRCKWVKNFHLQVHFLGSIHTKNTYWAIVFSEGGHFRCGFLGGYLSLRVVARYASQFSVIARL